MLAARMRAVQWLREVKDPRWPALAAVTIDAGMSRDDDARATPSDVVALHVGPRVGVPYDCSMRPDEKARAVEAILAKRGKVVGW